MIKYNIKELEKEVKKCGLLETHIIFYILVELIGINTELQSLNGHIKEYLKTLYGIK